MVSDDVRDGRDVMEQSKHITYNTAGNIVSLFCQWMIMMIIPKITDFAEAGIFAVALSICSILNIFATFSLNQYQISDQYVNFNENQYRLSRLVTIVLSFVMCITMLLLFDYSNEQKLVIVLYMVYRNILHYAYLYTATLQIRERLDYVGKCTMVEGVISLVAFVSAYVVTNDLALSVLIMALLGGGVFLISVIYGYRKTDGKYGAPERTDTAAVKSMLKLGIPLLISGVAPIIITALPKLMLQTIEGDEIVGIFSTLSAPTIVVPTLITGIFTPFIIYFSNVARSGNMSLLAKQYLKMTVMILGFGILCFVASYLLGGPVFEMLYGDNIAPYTKYFKVLIFGIILYSIGMCGITVMMTKEHGRQAGIASVIALIIGATIFAWAIPEYGMEGAVYGLMAAYGVFGLLISLCVLLIPLSKVVRD